MHACLCGPTDSPRPDRPRRMRARHGPPRPGLRRPARRVGARPSCRAGYPDALDAARFPAATSFNGATWQAFLRALGDTFTLTSVQSAPQPATSPMTPVLVSSEVVSEGRAENRWLRWTISLPSPPVAGVPAEVLLVVDAVRVDGWIGTGGLPPSAGVSAARVARAILGRAVGAEARLSRRRPVCAVPRRDGCAADGRRVRRDRTGRGCAVQCMGAEHSVPCREPCCTRARRDALRRRRLG